MGTLSSELGPYAGRWNGHAPRIYADANVPTGLVRFMRQRLGWDVLFVLEHQDLRRSSDKEHYALARQLRRTLITLDRDYLSERRFPSTRSGGVIVLHGPNERALIRILAQLDRAIFSMPYDHRPVLEGRKLDVNPDWQPEKPSP